MIHPPLDDLVAEPPSPEVAAHLRRCPRCRIDVRLHHAAAVPITDAAERDTAAQTLTLARSELSADAAAVLSGAGTALAQGQVAGAWVVEGSIGTGATATVYRVRHASTGQIRALKLMAPASDGVRRRIAREAIAQAALQHPNVVAVHEVIPLGSRTALLLDYVPGPSLRTLILDGALDLPAALQIGRDVLDGVAAAHALGFVHRDLKPANVLVSLHDATTLCARVADFGAAKDTAADATRLTRTGAVIGTPAYMAPEQIDDSAHVDASADVFALGAMLYELVTNRRPFRGDTIAALFDAIRTGAYPPLPSTLPSGTARAITSALVVDRQDRAPLEAVRAAWAEAAADHPTVSAAVLTRLGQLSPHDPTEAPPTLPPRSGALFGRSEEIARALHALTTHRHVAIAGAPGSGRTTLAHEVARRAAPAFPGGVKTGWPEGEAAPGSLVVLEEADPTAIAERLRADPHLCVLTTAILEPPPHPDDRALVPLGDLSPDAALALIRDRIRDTTTGSIRPNIDDPHLEAIVATIGGNPLALELAATRLGQAAPDRVLSALTGDGDPLHRCIARSWEALERDERTALLATLALPAPWTAADLARATDADELDVEDWVDALVAAGLARSHRSGTDVAFSVPGAVSAWLKAQPRSSGGGT